MKILFTPDVFLRLSSVSSVVNGREFSGYGFVKVDNKVEDSPNFIIEDIVLLDVGSKGWTEIPSKKILEVMNRPDAHAMKLWFHRHPVGDGKPGAHNWSGTDQNTCTKEPLGSPDPDAVGWALAAVLTPGGWVGRLDQFSGDKFKTTHIPVEVDLDFSIMKEARELLAEQIESETAQSDVGLNDSDFYFNTPSSVDGYYAAHADIDWGGDLLESARSQIKRKQYDIARSTLKFVKDIIAEHRSNTLVASRLRKLKIQYDAIRRALQRRTGEK